jgi:2-keto-4-pentenoate hydratase
MSTQDISTARASELKEVAKELATARETSVLIDDLGGPMQLKSIEEAYAVQQAMLDVGGLGPVGGWKVGSAGAKDMPAFSPMPLRWINTTALTPGKTAMIQRHRYRLPEAEIAFRVGTSLPPRGEKYSRAEVMAAMQSCHPAIEILEAAFTNPETVKYFSQVADLQSNGGFVPGPPVKDWKKIDFTKERAQLVVNCEVRADGVGTNSNAVDLMRLVEWLVNVGSVQYGGVKAGDWITTGNWTGKNICPSGAEVTAKFSTAGSVTLKFL